MCRNKDIKRSGISPLFFVSFRFSALFLMEHMWVHFFEDALTLKQVVDWMVMWSICWQKVYEKLLKHEIELYGFCRFTQGLNRITDLLLNGESPFASKTKQRRDYGCRYYVVFQWNWTKDGRYVYNLSEAISMTTGSIRHFINIRQSTCWLGLVGLPPPNDIDIFI